VKMFILKSILLSILISNITIAASVADTPYIYSSVKEWTLSKDSNKYDIVKDYVHYKLYFADESDKDKKDMCLSGANNDLLTNNTASLFAAAIDMCPVKKYSPRILASTQVSFQRNDDRSQKTPNNESQQVPLVNQSQASTLSAAENNSSIEAAEETAETPEDKPDIVHEYLAIALVLPHHPFSRALIDSMHIITPMYPSVTVYFGIASEFQSLCNQYGVRSYPMLLLFHKGLLVDKHRNTNGEKYKPAKLAKRFSRWTNRLPRTDPVPRPRKHKTAGFKSDHETLFEIQNVTALAHVVKDWCVNVDIASMWGANTTTTGGSISSSNLDFGESIEPVVSLLEDPKAWDIPVYLLSSCYVFIRLLYYIWTTFFVGTPPDED
jgi:hypothetical protein